MVRYFYRTGVTPWWRPSHSLWLAELVSANKNDCRKTAADATWCATRLDRMLEWRREGQLQFSIWNV